MKETYQKKRQIVHPAKRQTGQKKRHLPHVTCGCLLEFLGQPFFYPSNGNPRRKCLARHLPPQYSDCRDSPSEVALVAQNHCRFRQTKLGFGSQRPTHIPGFMYVLEKDFPLEKTEIR